MKYYLIDHSANEIEGYQPSLDGSDDNFNFNDDYDDDVKSFSTMFIFLFCFLFQMSRKLEYAFGHDEYL